MNTNISMTAGEEVAPLEQAAKLVAIGGRLLIAILFILAGITKVIDAKPFLNHMTEFGVPTFLLPAVIVLELGAGLALALGWRIREAAAALALFCVLTAVIFHHQVWIGAERTSFFKDLAIAGGLFAIAAHALAQSQKKNV